MWPRSGASRSAAPWGIRCASRRRRPATRLRFLTEGVLTRRLLSDPDRKRVGTVVLDEFHERHLEGDLALALLRRLQQTRRPDLRLVVMSATLDVAPVAGYLGGARVLRSQGRQFPLEIEYTPHSAAPLEDQVAAALERLGSRSDNGHVLVFLPGAGRDPPRTDCLRRAGESARMVGAAAARRPVAGRAGSRRRPERPPQNHPLHQRGGEFHHHRWGERGDR